MGYLLLLLIKKVRVEITTEVEFFTAYLHALDKKRPDTSRSGIGKKDHISRKGCGQAASAHLITIKNIATSLYNVLTPMHFLKK